MNQQNRGNEKNKLENKMSEVNQSNNIVEVYKKTMIRLKYKDT